MSTVPRALLWATDIELLPLDRVLERRDGYLVLRSPSNPDHYWGNLLLFDEPPGPGDGDRWERLFQAEFEGDARVRHVTLAWDRPDGAVGSACQEFAPRSYDLQATVGLVAAPDAISSHPRENREVTVRSLDPAPGADTELWERVVALQVDADERAEAPFRRRRLAHVRRLIELGRGGTWYVALDGGEVVGSLGLIVTGGRGRFQDVVTAEAHRRRGICSRLLVEAARDAGARFGARRLVIAADPEYHALGLYQSLGFQPRERVSGVCRRP